MKILVPVDGSQNSMDAVKAASEYAKTAKAEVYLITVSPFISGLDLEISAGAMDSLNEGMKSRGEGVLKKAQGILAAEGISVMTILSSSISDNNHNGQIDEGCGPPPFTETVVSVASDGTLANRDSGLPSISADGRFVAFVSMAFNLGAGDTNFYADVFVHDRDADQDGVFDELGLGERPIEGECRRRRKPG